MDKCSETIIVNGVTMLLADYRKLKRSQLNIKPKKKVVVISEVKILSSDIQYMVNKIRLIKSLYAYYDNAYRQWGNIGKRVLNLREIRKPFVMYRAKVREMSHTMDLIVSESKKNKKSVYELIRKLGYQIDDIRICMDELFDGINKSCVIQRFYNHECICGSSKRLGLKMLMSRSLSAQKELTQLIANLQIISNGK